MRMTRSVRVSLLLLAIIALVALVPAVALAQPAGHVTMAQIKARGANGLRALELAGAGTRTAAAAQYISGHVTLPGPYSADASVTAIGFTYDTVNIPNAWAPTYFASLDASGNYSMDVDPGAKVKVGFTDSQRVYADSFYDAVGTVSAATTITVDTSTPVPNINATLTANPVNLVSGQVHYSGATNSDPVGVGVYQIDSTSGSPTFGQFIQIYSEKTDASGNYRVHLLAAGNTKLGFTDFNDVFSSIFYQTGNTVSEGTTVTVVTNTPSTGLDVTMTVQPSSRISGTDPYGTAIALSQSQFQDGFGGTVVLAATNSPDSLAGGPYALAESGPLLLTSATTMPSSVRTEIQRLNPMQVVILGGSGAVSIDTEEELRDMGIPLVRRLMGKDRYDTAAQVAQELVNAGLVPANPHIAVANGTGYADAVAGGPVAAANAMPLLLVRTTSIPASTQKFITKNSPPMTLVFGGSGVINDTVFGALPGAVRLGGIDRYDTAALIAAYGIDTLSMQPRVVGLGGGANAVLQNSLAAAPVLGARNQVLLLTPANSLSPYIDTFLTGRAGTIARITAIGDATNVSDTTFAAAKTAAGIH